jgi:hypothetical protein
MKFFKSLLVLGLFFVINTVSAQSMAEKWPAIKAFHGVMSQTFHPAEEGNFEPIKKRSQEMVEKAAALSTSDIPSEYKTKAILASIEKLQISTKELNKMVQDKLSDSDLLKKLSLTHDVFHEIMGLCSAEKH